MKNSVCARFPAVWINPNVHVYVKDHEADDNTFSVVEVLRLEDKWCSR